jgi:hypothetical protein
VGLPGRDEWILDTDMELLGSDRHRGSTALTRPLGLLDLNQIEELAEEPPRAGPAARRRGDLNVVGPVIRVVAERTA